MLNIGEFLENRHREKAVLFLWT